MALGQRRPAAVIHHSDQGSQYTALAFGRRCEKAGVRPSMGSAGDCFDNAMCESFFATLECELLERRHFKTQIEARLAIFEFIEGCTTRIAAIRRSTICLPLTSREPIGRTLITAALHRPPKRGNSRVALMHHGRLRAVGSPAALKRALGPHATLEDAFRHYAGADLDSAEGGSFRDVRRNRTTVQRLG
jgi:hypothetical protein